MADYEWNVTQDTWCEIDKLNNDLENLKVTEEEYVERLMSLPGYPLSGLPQQGDDLRITLAAAPAIYYNRKDMH